MTDREKVVKIMENGGKCNDMYQGCNFCILHKDYDTVCVSDTQSKELAEKWLIEHPDTEWKNLDLNNLPSDILAGDYEWEIQLYGSWVNKATYLDEPKYMYIKRCVEGYKFRYRVSQPVQNMYTHEERMSLWWEFEDDVWGKVAWYKSDKATYAFDRGTSGVWRCFFVNVEWFNDKRSAKIPPEKKEL